MASVRARFWTRHPRHASCLSVAVMASRRRPAASFQSFVYFSISLMPGMFIFLLSWLSLVLNSFNLWNRGTFSDRILWVCSLVVLLLSYRLLSVSASLYVCFLVLFFVSLLCISTDVCLCNQHFVFLFLYFFAIAKSFHVLESRSVWLSICKHVCILSYLSPTNRHNFLNSCSVVVIPSICCDSTRLILMSCLLKINNFHCLGRYCYCCRLYCRCW